MNIYIKDTIFKICGYAFLIIGITICMIALGMTVEGDKNGPPIAIASLAFIIPGIFFVIKGRNISKEDEKIQSIISIVKSYRRITVEQLSGKIYLSIPETIRLLTKAMSIGKIEGHFDRTTDEFFTTESREDIITYKFCPSCGASFDKVYFKGETIKCNACGGTIK